MKNAALATGFPHRYVFERQTFTAESQANYDHPV